MNDLKGGGSSPPYVINLSLMFHLHSGLKGWKKKVGTNLEKQPNWSYYVHRMRACLSRVRLTLLSFITQKLEWSHQTPSCQPLYPASSFSQERPVASMEDSTHTLSSIFNSVLATMHYPCKNSSYSVDMKYILFPCRWLKSCYYLTTVSSYILDTPSHHPTQF